MSIVLMALVVDGMILSIDVPGLDTWATKAFFSRTTAEEGCCSETPSLIDLPSVLLFTPLFVFVLCACLHFCPYFLGAIYSSHWLKVPHAGTSISSLKNLWGAGAPLNSNYLLLLLYCSHPY